MLCLLVRLLPRPRTPLTQGASPSLDGLAGLGAARMLTPGPPPRTPGVHRAGPGHRESDVARSPLRPPLCLTASSLPFLKLKESLDTRQFDPCVGSVSGGRWRSCSGAASMLGLSGAGGVAGGAPGPPPRGPDLPACPWGVSVRCARGCWVVSSPRPLCRGLASPAGDAACPAPPWGAGLGSLSPHLQANGGFASSGSHWGCLEGLRAGPLGPAFVAGGDSDVWGLPVTGRTLGCV